MKRHFKTSRAHPPPAKIRTDGITAFFDGACWPSNGGHAGAGALVKRDAEIIFAHSEYIGVGEGITTANVAEYRGLIAVLEYFLANSITEACVYGDSNMVINQMNGVWAAGNPTKQEKKGLVLYKPRVYLPHYQIAIALRVKLPNVRFFWIRRESNTEADELSTRELKARGFREIFYMSEPQPESATADLDYAEMRFNQAILED